MNPYMRGFLVVTHFLFCVPLSAQGSSDWDDWSNSRKNDLPDTPLSRAARAVKDRPIGAGWTFSLGGSAQELFQKIDNHRQTLFESAEDNFSMLARERVNMEFKSGTLFRAYVEVQDARLVWGSGWGTVWTSAKHNDFFLDLYQAYAELGLRPDIVDKPSLVLRVGRQELVLGSRILFSENDWLNTGRTFDLARAIWRPDGFQIDAFAGWPAKLDADNLKLPASQTNLAGVNLKALGIPFRQNVEGLLVYKWNDKPNFEGERGILDVERLWTLSGRASGHFFKHWDYEADATFQTGERGEDNVFAWNAFAQLGYTFKLGLWRRLRLALQYSQSSGDKDPNDGTSQTFDPLFGDQFSFHGKLLKVGEKNLEDLASRLSAKVWKGGTIEIDYHFFKLHQATDGFYEASGDVFRRELAGLGGRDMGRELDTQITHAFHENLSVSGGVFLFEPGRFFKRTGNHSHNEATDFFFMVRTSF